MVGVHDYKRNASFKWKPTDCLQQWTAFGLLFWQTQLAKKVSLTQSNSALTNLAVNKDVWTMRVHGLGT